MSVRLIGMLALLLAIGCSEGTRVNRTGQINSAAPNEGPVEALAPDGPNLQEPEPVFPRPREIDLTQPGAVARGTASPTIIDTRNFKPQIQNSGPWAGLIQPTSILRPGKVKVPEPPPGPANDLVTGNLLQMRRVFPGPLFPGVVQSPWTPPDPTIAVGPNHIVQTVNMELAFFNKDGTQTFQQRLDSSGSPGFFETIGGGNFTFDPKCFYDHYAGRFVVLALERYTDIQEAWITFAVSDDADPNGIWFKYRTWAVVAQGSLTFWVDYPGLGYDQSGYYITGNLFGLNHSGFGGVLFRAIDKVPLLNGQSATFNDLLSTTAASVQVAQAFSASAAPLFVSRGSNTTLNIRAMNNPHSDSPSITDAAVSVPSGPSPPLAPNIGGDLEIVGSRIMNAHFRDGRLWTCNTVDIGGRAVARWYEINIGNWPSSGSPSLVQSGNIDLGTGNHTFFPAIYTDSNNNAALVIGKSRSNEFASVMATGRLNSDPLGTMGTPEQLAIGDSAANGRWGDYFDIALDPVNNSLFWMVGQYETDFGWQTTIHSFSLQSIIVAEAVSVVRGLQFAGDLSDTSQSDDAYLQFHPELTDNPAEPPICLEFTGTTQIETPVTLQFAIESGVNTVGLVQEVALFNYDTGSFEVVSLQTPAMPDTVVTADATGDVSRFLQAGTGEIKTRLTWQPDGPVLQYPWSISIDQVSWTVTQ